MTNKQQRLIDTYNATARMIEGYRKMLEVAREYGCEYEIERQTANIAEYEADMDEQMDAMIQAGVTPEMVDA